tara:strand:+ start:30622 stop:32022 length:1401 start_codon:yes stop_codon:yes gene_type:complete
VRLYQKLEQDFRQQIDSGQLSPGERMPSVRELCRAKKISKSTVLAAYTHLEAEGLIEARMRSGYFVCQPQQPELKLPDTSQPKVRPTPVSADQVLLDIMERGAAFDLKPNAPGNEDSASLRRSLARAQRLEGSQQQLYYDDPQGSLELRQQLAQRIAHGGASVQADDMTVTHGCQHALLLALMATTEPGDVVAVESPGFYGTFQLLEALGLKALELPCSASDGLSPEALELATQHWDIKALVVSPSFATPTGASMPEDHKLQILSLAEKHQFTIIEDDIYGEIYFDLQRPRSIYSYDTKGWVILCSSFSKSLSRDLRIGWIVSERHIDTIKKLKIVTALASSQTLQLGVSNFLSDGGLEKHMRQQRLKYRQQHQQLTQLLNQNIPEVISCSNPKGGLSVWLELPKQINTLKLYSKARERGLILTPGRLFTAQERYFNFLRMSFVHPWTAERKKAVEDLGELVRQEL